MDYEFIEYYRRAYEETSDPALKQEALQSVRKQEAFRDFYIGGEYDSDDMIDIIIFICSLEHE